ncbi:subtilisin inhibitor-like [Phalaenopsis equestris]|uniref:subtilisin inhibitor-like n=1 Tax=Phalaenopsis equestris TaxID=78828 RepID=UPI0009E3DE5F|nr:subtilisin inhibitor-like [Phalaenopsis equestris]
MDQESNNPANKKSEGKTTSALTSWPDVVGLPAEEAERRIKEDNPKLRLQVVGPDGCVTADFVTDRVWIFVDSEGKVIRTPTIG